MTSGTGGFHTLLDNTVISSFGILRAWCIFGNCGEWLYVINRVVNSVRYYSSNGRGSSIFNSFAYVPEPGTPLLLGSGPAGLGIFARRKKM